MQPLILFYSYNCFRRTIAYIFIQTHLKRFSEYSGTERVSEFGYGFGKRLSALEVGDLVKKQLEDKESFGISQVEVIVDNTKAQIVNRF